MADVLHICVDIYYIYGTGLMFYIYIYIYIYHRYGTGLMFFSKADGVYDKCKTVIEKHCAEKGFEVSSLPSRVYSTYISSYMYSLHDWHVHARCVPTHPYSIWPLSGCI